MNSGTGIIAAVGPPDTVKAFPALGIRVVATDDLSEARRAIDQLAEEGCSIILVPDNMLAMMPDILETYAGRPVPAITALPGPRGDTPFSTGAMRDTVRKAIGVRIMG